MIQEILILIFLITYIICVISLWFSARKETEAGYENKEIYNFFIMIFFIFCPIINLIFYFFVVFIPWYDNHINDIRIFIWSIFLMKDLRKK